MKRPRVGFLRVRVGVSARRWLLASLATCAGGIAPSFGFCGAAYADTGQPTTLVLTLDAVRANIRGALGLDALAARSGPITMTGTGNVGGMPCTIEQVLAPDGRSFRRTIGGITLEGGFDGRKHWVRDIGGEYRVLGLGNLVEAQITSAILSGAWLSGDSPLILALGDGDSSAVVITFTIAGAETTGRVLVDPETWLPTRWEFTSGATTQTIDLEGVVSLDGFHTSAHVTQGSSTGASTVVSVESVRASTEAETAWLTPDAAPPADTRFDRSVGPALEVRRAPTGHLLVHPTVDGKDVGWFIFDTGAGANVLASGAIEALGIEPFGEVPAVGVGGATKARFARPGSLVLGPMTYEAPLMVVMDLAFLEPYMGVKVGGVLGFSLLARTVAEVDFVDAAISLHDPATFDRAPKGWSELVLDDRVPCVRASVEGHEGWFRLDTGANGTVTMHEPAVRELKLLEGRESTDSQLGGVGGFVKAKKAKLATFEIGGQKIENVTADMAIEAVGAFGDAASLGNIGTELIRPFRLVLDYPRHRLALIPRDPTPAK
jgi:predicted aspartyl protease